MNIKSRVWLEVSKKKLQNNLRCIADYVAPLSVMAVVKADAYGLGVEPVSRILSETGRIAAFGVAEVSAGLKIKSLGVPVHILGAILDEEVSYAVEQDFVLPVTDFRIAEIISREAGRQGRSVLVQLVLDTGMGRLGIRSEEALEVVKKILKLKNLNIKGVYSHFPSAYEDQEFSREQVREYSDLLKAFQSYGMNPEIIQIANSDGIHNIPEAISSPFNMVRSGINLYGAYDMRGNRAFGLEEVLELKSRLVAVRKLPVGATVGYGRSCVLDTPTLVGTVSAGYADGVPLALSNKGEMIVRGKRCRVLGKVSMDFTTIDLSEVPEVASGDEVTCLGQGISVIDWARIKGTHPYDIICSFGSRVLRSYV